jgi:hypothetical protein
LWFNYKLANLIVKLKSSYRQFFRKGEIELDVYPSGEGYKASAFDGKYGVYNNYGSTPEMAKEMALYKLKKCYELDKAPLE